MPNPVLAPIGHLERLCSRSKFVFRMQMGPRCACLRLTAGLRLMLARIKAFLEEELKAEIPIIS